MSDTKFYLMCVGLGVLAWLLSLAIRSALA